MTTITERKPAPSTSTTDTIPTANLTAVLAAFNAANLASSYIERGNFTAARRKLALRAALRLALAALEKAIDDGCATEAHDRMTIDGDTWTIGGICALAHDALTRKGD